MTLTKNKTNNVGTNLLTRSTMHCFSCSSIGSAYPREVRLAVERDDQDSCWSGNSGEIAERRTIESRQDGVKICGIQKQSADGKRPHDQRTKKSQ